MARRMLEEELLEKEGIVIPPLTTPKNIVLVKEIHIHRTFRGVFSFQFSYNGEILAVGYGSSGIQTFDTTNGKMLQELRACRQGGFSVMCLRFHPKNPIILYAATTEGQVLIYNIRTGEELATIEEPGNEINTIDFCADGYNFATGGRDLGVRIYDTKTNKIFQRFEGIGTMTSDGANTVNQTMRIFCIKYHSENQFVFISGGWDNLLKIWDVRSNDGIKRVIRGPHICGDAIDLKDGRILTGQWTALHALQEYEYSSGKMVRELKYPHRDGAFLYCALYANDDLVIAGGSGTYTAEIMDISSNKSVASFDIGAPIQAIDSARKGRSLAVGGANDSFYIYSLSD